MSFSDCFSRVQRDRWSNLVLFVDLRKGDYRDLSSRAHEATIPSTAPDWTRSIAGRGIRCTNQQTLRFPAAAALGLTSFTCFVGISDFTAGLNMQLFFSASPNFVFAWSDTTFVVQEPGGAYAVCAYALGGRRPRSVSMTNAPGTPVRGFVDGTLAGVTAGNCTLNGASTAFRHWPNSPGYNNQVVNHCISLFNVQLTDAEILQLHSDYIHSGGSLR